LDNPKYYNLLFAILQFDKSIYKLFSLINLDKANPNYLAPISPIYFFYIKMQILIIINIMIN